jgi:hypothetical protein
MRPTRKYCHPEALLLREGRDAEDLIAVGVALGDEPLICSLIRLVIDEAMNFVFPGESIKDAGFVLVDAMLEITGNSDIENTGAAGHDVNGIKSPSADAVGNGAAWAKQPRNSNLD